MRNFFARRIISIVIIFSILGAGLIVFLLLFLFNAANKAQPAAPAAEKVADIGPVHTVIGKSVEGRNIDAYTYGSGKKHLLFVGGIHGGYEWNSVVLAYDFLDYLDAHPDAVPASLSVTVIPSANPDGVYKLIGKEGRFASEDVLEGVPTAPARFNADDVDLNRNFDCKWQPKSTWQNKVESAGTSPFSEPEAAALRDFISKNNPVAAVFWHSQSGAVYASQCEKGILPATLEIMNAYAKASGYKAVPVFDAYQTTGDAESWLASIGVPSITVELTTHETIEWEKNLAGVKALFEYYR